MSVMSPTNVTGFHDSPRRNGTHREDNSRDEEQWRAMVRRLRYNRRR